MAYGSFYNFSPRDFIYNIDMNLMLFALTFLIVTALVRFVLVKRLMRDSQTSASVIAICVGLLASYGALKSNITLNFFSAINLTPEFLMKILPWLVLLLAAGIIARWGLGILFVIFGTILAGAGFLDLIFAKGFAIWVGILLLIIGLKLIQIRNRRRRYKNLNAKDREIYKRERRQNIATTNARWNRAGYKIGTKIGKARDERRKRGKIRNRALRIKRIREERLAKEQNQAILQQEKERERRLKEWNRQQALRINSQTKLSK